MKKINIVKKNIEFNNIMKTGDRFVSDIFYVYVKNNIYNYNRFGVSVSKKIGNAVNRNKYKRRIRSIIDKYEFSILGYDMIVISRPSIKNFNYSYIENNLFNLLNKIGDKYEKK